MTRIIQASMARGEIGPDLYGRVDVAAYSIALRTALNMVIHSYGGASNRAGLMYVGPCSSHSGTPPELIRFAYNTQDQYILEFGDDLMRVIREDAYVLNAAVTITGVTQGSPGVATAAGHGFSDGDDVYIVDVVGMTELNGRWFTVANKDTNTFELTSQQTGVDIDTSGYSAYTSGGTVSSVYEIATPYDIEDVAELQNVQSANVMTLVHPSYPPYKLSRTDHDAWTLAAINFSPSQASPTGLSVVSNAGSGTTYYYKVTAINEDTLEESLPTAQASVSGGTTPDNTASWTGAASALKYSVYREVNGLFGWIGDTEDVSFIDENIEPDLSLTPPKSREPFDGADDYPRAVSYYEQRKVYGGTNNKPDTTQYSVAGNEDNMSQSSPRGADDSITATLNSLEVNEIRFFVPLNDLLTFTSGSEWKTNAGTEAAFSAETLRQKPQSNWGIAEIPPVVVGDKVLYVTENRASVRSMGYEIMIDGYKGNEMTVFAPHIFEESKAVDWAFTRWPDPVINVVREDGYAPALTFNPEQEVVAWSRWNTKGKFKRVASARPTADSVDHFSYFVVERTIGSASAYYVERVHSRRFTDVRDCFFVDSGLSLDEPKVITDITNASPAVVTSTAHGFSDGDKVDLSDIVWEADVDDHYNETQPNQLNNWRYQVASAGANTFELVSNEGRVDITGATQANPIVITAVAHGFSDGEIIGVFNVAGMTELNGNTYKVSSSTDDTFELTDFSDVDIDSSGYTAYTSGGTMYPAVDSSAMTDYVEGGNAREVVTILSGLWHLEGQEVVILADGNVVDGEVVSGGQVTIAEGASRAHVGLRYVADLETLNPELVVAGQTLQGRNVRVPSLTVRLKNTRGLLVGSNALNLTEMKQRERENYGEPTHLLTGDKGLEINSDWSDGGRMFLRQIHPLPVTVTAIIPELDVGDDGDGG